MAVALYSLPFKTMKFSYFYIEISVFDKGDRKGAGVDLSLCITNPLLDPPLTKFAASN